MIHICFQDKGISFPNFAKIVRNEGGMFTKIIAFEGRICSVSLEDIIMLRVYFCGILSTLSVRVYGPVRTYTYRFWFKKCSMLEIHDCVQ